MSDDRETQAPKQPVDRVWDGNLKASIWENEGEKGKFYATSFARTYKDANGDYRDSNWF